MNCCFIAPPQTGHRFAFDLIAYHAQIKLLFSIYLRYRWSRCRSDDTAERSGKQNFLHIIGVEFDPKHYKGKWPCTTKTLYNEKTLIGRLHQYFLIYFETFFVPTADTLFLLILSILTLCYNLSSASPPWIFLLFWCYHLTINGCAKIPTTNWSYAGRLQHA